VNPKNRTFLIVAGAVLLVVVAAIVAVVATGGSDDDSSSSDVAQTRPVEATGEPLAPFETQDVDPTVDPAVGQPAPVVAGENFEGEAITIGEPADEPTLLVFLAHWCPHCNREVPELLALDDAGGIPGDLNVVGISTAVASDRPNYPPSEWIVDKGWRWPVMVDDEVGTAMTYYGGTGFPFLVMLDADGTVLARQSGESTADELGAWIDAVLS
jgi:cytochrome c biogenesis protein CcmG, thiol:disulfide interchange protein DsbE